MNELTRVTLRRRKGWQKRTTHSFVDAKPNAYARKEGLVEIINVDIPTQSDTVDGKFVAAAKDEVARARKDGRLKKTADVGQTTTLTYRPPEDRDPKRPDVNLVDTGALTCPDCGRPGILRESNGLTYCRVDCRPGDPVDVSVDERIVALGEDLVLDDELSKKVDLELKLEAIADSMTAAREGLEELTRLLLKVKS